MKDIRTEIPDTVPDISKELPSPHFDELAVAIAQPVQPLPLQSGRRVLQSSLFLIAYVAFIAVVVAVAYVAPARTREDTLTEATATETQSDAQPALGDAAPAAGQSSSTGTSLIRYARPHPRRLGRLRFQNQTTEILEDGAGKPIPRKVGEIRYGRSPDRP